MKPIDMKSLQQFLTEAKIDVLKKKWENKLNFSHDSIANESYLHNYDNLTNDEYQKTSENDYFQNNYMKSYWDSDEKREAARITRNYIIDDIYNIDPHPNKAYTEWMIKHYHAGEYQIEDMDDNEDMGIYHQNKHQLPAQQRDINSFKTYNEFKRAIQPFKEKEDLIEQPKDLEKEAPLIYDNNGVKVYHPLTKESSCALGGSTWCTSNLDKHRNLFDMKNSQGPFYIVHIPSEKAPYRKIGIHPATREFQDENNRNIINSGRLDDFINRNPELLKTPIKDHIKGILGK